MTAHCDAEAMLGVWSAMRAYYSSLGFTKIIYRPTPHIYHSYPAEEDLYAIFRNGGRLSASLISSVVDNRCPLGFDMTGRQAVRKAAKNGISVRRSDRWEEFWAVLDDCLRERHRAAPVHTIAEIRLLQSRFPDNIRLYTAEKDGSILAGIVMYVCRRAAHSQYTASTSEGRALRAIPPLYAHIMEDLRELPYFDFGSSNEDRGRVLNLGLIRQKCGFGGRAIAYNTWEADM